VTAERGAGNWWVLECDEVGAVSQVRRLDQAAEEMREAIAYLAGAEPESFDIEVRPVIPGPVKDLIDEAGEHRQRAADEQRQATDALRRAARTMHAEGLSYREIGAVIGLSHQRVAQLVA
jgi:DNA-directed RNA polymerase specialized sigma24 family protein